MVARARAGPPRPLPGPGPAGPGPGGAGPRTRPDERTKIGRPTQRDEAGPSWGPAPNESLEGSYRLCPTYPQRGAGNTDPPSPLPPTSNGERAPAYAGGPPSRWSPSFSSSTYG